MRVSTLMLWIFVICLILGSSRGIAVIAHADDLSASGIFRFILEEILLFTTWIGVLAYPTRVSICDRSPFSYDCKVGFTAIICTITSVGLVYLAMFGFT